MGARYSYKAKDLEFVFPSTEVAANDARERGDVEIPEVGRIRGPGTIGLKALTKVNSASMRIVEGRDEFDLPQLQYHLFREWALDPKTTWNLTKLEPEPNGPIVVEGHHYREVPFPKTAEVIDGQGEDKIDPNDAQLIGLQLAIHFYPQMFVQPTEWEAEEEGNATGVSADGASKKTTSKS